MNSNNDMKINIYVLTYMVTLIMHTKMEKKVEVSVNQRNWAG